MLDGEAFKDACGTCVGGDTGLTACVEDCNGDPGGEAFEDACGACVGGGTGLTACVEDCNGDPGGEAFEDACGTCVGGGTGLTACVGDCNGDPGGEAFEDACGACVGGATGLEPCVVDCNGDVDGHAVLDGCGNCLGGKTGVASCTESCGSMVGGGSRYISLTTFDWAPGPEDFEELETRESIFGRVKRVKADLRWLEGRAQVAFPAGRWMIDIRGSSGWLTRWQLGAVPESEDCAPVSRVNWQTTFAEHDLWRVRSEKLFLEASQACSVELILKSTDDARKHDSRFDWIRIRHACSVDADCPMLEGGPAGVCLSEACSYDGACF